MEPILLNSSFAGFMAFKYSETWDVGLRLAPGLRPAGVSGRPGHRADGA